MKRMLLVVTLLVALAGASAFSAEMTYIDLVNKLTDLEGLAAYPSIGEKCMQFSSYCRASYYDEQTGKYIDWSDNNDWGGIIREESNTVVLAEMEGPGCIWRIWSATANDGHVKIYLDNSDKPAVDIPFSGYFDGLHMPFIFPSLVNIVANGKNCYVPIPYQKSCKIVAEEDWGAYYHFTYTAFPKDTILPTFKRDLSPEELGALAKADRLLSFHLGSDPAGKRQGEATEHNNIQVPPGKTITVADMKGPQAITAIRVKFDPKSMRDAAKTLREVALQIKWDGEKSPSVWTPLGDFFGTAPGVNYHKSLPLGMSEDGNCYCFWYMPFASSALVQLVNDGKSAFPVEVSITHAPLSRPIEQFGRFHAKWHRDVFLPAEPERSIDWTMLKTRGIGRFCGVMLNVWNPKGGWWGEGDEKFFVDGEKFPSTFGTGSEDYFGYAWSDPALFQNAYHNQTTAEDDNAGHISVNRWQITDNIPFQKSFEGNIEKYWPNDKPTQYSCIVYWYLSPDGIDSYKPVTPARERTDYYIQPKVYREAGALEGEGLNVIEITDGKTLPQRLNSLRGAVWSGDTQLWWQDAMPGSRLTLAIPVEKTDKYEIKVVLTKAPDYGIVQLLLDGVKIGNPVDLYDSELTHTGVLSFEARNLNAGEHKLTVEIVGANEKTGGNHLFGLDYIKLEPAN